MRALGLTLLLLLLVPSWAVAHAGLVQSEPAAGESLPETPRSIRLVLAAPVEETGIAASVLAPDGAELAREVMRSAVDPQAIEIAVGSSRVAGSYQVRWRVFSNDGHVTYGLRRFAIGDAPADRSVSEEAAEGLLHVVGRTFALLGPILLVGLVTLRIAVARDTAPRPGPALWWWAWTVGIALWAIGLSLVVVETVSAFGRDPFGGFATAPDPGIYRLLTETRWGIAIAVQVGALAAAYVAEQVARRAAPKPWSATPALWGLAAAPAISLIAISWSGHASTGGDAAVGVAVDAAHNIATGVWIGGLVGLVVLVLVPGDRLTGRTRLALVAPAVVRFSALAIGAVTVLVVTGVYRALAELGSLADLLETGYGQALSVKLAIFGSLLVVGAYNRFVAHPRLERAHLGLADDDRGAARRLLATVQLEIVLAVALIGVVGVLISLAPPV